MAHLEKKTSKSSDHYGQINPQSTSYSYIIYNYIYVYNIMCMANGLENRFCI